MSEKLTPEKIRELDIGTEFTYTFYNHMGDEEKRFIRGVLCLLFWALKTDSRNKVRAIRKAATKKLDLIDEKYGEDSKVLERIKYEYFDKRHCERYEWWKDKLYEGTENAVESSDNQTVQAEQAEDIIEEMMTDVQKNE